MTELVGYLFMINEGAGEDACCVVLGLSQDQARHKAHETLTELDRRVYQDVDGEELSVSVDDLQVIPLYRNDDEVCVVAWREPKFVRDPIVEMGS